MVGWGSIVSGVNFRLYLVHVSIQCSLLLDQYVVYIIYLNYCVYICIVSIYVWPLSRDMSILTVDEDALANEIEPKPKAEKHIPRLIEMVATQILLLPQLVEDSLASNNQTPNLQLLNMFLLQMARLLIIAVIRSRFTGESTQAFNKIVASIFFEDLSGWWLVSK